MALPLGVCGPSLAADGDAVPVRLDTSGATVVGQSHARSHESSARGAVYVCYLSTVTLNTTIGGSGAVILQNPVNSGIMMSLLWVSVARRSGTMGAGSIVLTVPSKLPTVDAGAGALIKRARLGNSVFGANGSECGVYTGQQTNFGTQIPVRVRTLASFGAIGSASDYQPSPTVDNIAGEIGALPGFYVSVEGVSTAGTSPRWDIALCWEEIKLVGDSYPRPGTL